MRHEPTALAYINDEVTVSPKWEVAQCQRLARQLGYQLIWPTEDHALGLADRIREIDVDAVIVPSSLHLDDTTLDRLMDSCDVEAVQPRTSYARHCGSSRAGSPA
ncbi:hypothetical protein ACWDUL_20840 [Nocardia niigatensis]